MSANRSRRVTLRRGQTLRIGGIPITFVRERADGQIVLDLPTDQPLAIDRRCRTRGPARLVRRAESVLKTR